MESIEVPPHQKKKKHQWTNEIKQSMLTDTEKRLVVTRREGASDVGKIGEDGQLYGDEW